MLASGRGADRGRARGSRARGLRRPRVRGRRRRRGRSRSTWPPRPRPRRSRSRPRTLRARLDGTRLSFANDGAATTVAYKLRTTSQRRPVDVRVRPREARRGRDRDRVAGRQAACALEVRQGAHAHAVQPRAGAEGEDRVGAGPWRQGHGEGPRLRPLRPGQRRARPARRQGPQGDPDRARGQWHAHVRLGRIDPQGQEGRRARACSSRTAPPFAPTRTRRRTIAPLSAARPRARRDRRRARPHGRTGGDHPDHHHDAGQPGVPALPTVRQGRRGDAARGRVDRRRGGRHDRLHLRRDRRSGARSRSTRKVVFAAELPYKTFPRRLCTLRAVPNKYNGKDLDPFTGPLVAVTYFNPYETTTSVLGADRAVPMDYNAQTAHRGGPSDLNSIAGGALQQYVWTLGASVGTQDEGRPQRARGRRPRRVRRGRRAAVPVRRRAARRRLRASTACSRR